MAVQLWRYLHRSHLVYTSLRSQRHNEVSPTRLHREAGLPLAQNENDHVCVDRFLLFQRAWVWGVGSALRGALLFLNLVKTRQTDSISAGGCKQMAK